MLEAFKLPLVLFLRLQRDGGKLRGNMQRKDFYFLEKTIVDVASTVVKCRAWNGKRFNRAV